MADDIAALLAGAAKIDYNPKFEDIPKQYWNRLEEAYKQRTRDVFQDPSLYDAQGNIDPQKALSASLKAGGLAQAENSARIGDIAIQQGILRNTEKRNLQASGGDQPAEQPLQQAQPKPVYPPSPNRPGGKQAAPDLTATPRTGATAPAQTAGAPAAGPFAKFLEAQNVPPEQHAKATLDIQSAIMAKTGSPFKPLDMNNPAVRPHVQDVLRDFALNRANQGLNPNAVRTASDQQPPQPQQPPPPQIAQQPVPLPRPAPGAGPGGPGGAAAALPPQPQVAPPPPQAPPIVVRPQPQQQAPQPEPIAPQPAQTAPVVPINPAVASGAITPRDLKIFGSPEKVQQFYEDALREGQLTKATTEAYQKKLAGITEANKLDEKQRTAASLGMTAAQYNASEEKKKLDKELLEKVYIPQYTASKTTSEAANNEIKTYHAAKDVLNQPGGIIAGLGGDHLLAVAKAAGKYLNIPEAANAANRTEAFRAIMSGGVLQTVKQLGAGSGITNADVKFASDMVGKNITLDEDSIRRIIHLSEKVARRKIADHNAGLDRMVAANPAYGEVASSLRVEPAPLRITVGRKISVGDVFDGREYYGGPINKESSWSNQGKDVGPDTWRAQ